jgi:predicted ArsR family transcriptional regulator
MDRAPTPTSQLARLAGLGENPRRALYVHVLKQETAVSRDEAAAAVGISRPLAAYHLDKLADAGLLDVSFERRSGRQGPGAGRPSKLYRRSANPVEIQIPARDYALMGELLAEAVESPDDPPRLALQRAAARAGEQTRRSACAEKTVQRQEGLMRLLSHRGYEPYEDGEGTLRFRNCPFHHLAQQHRELICTTNLAYIEGLTGPLFRAAGGRARLDPKPGECCVALDVPHRPSDDVDPE